MLEERKEHQQRSEGQLSARVAAHPREFDNGEADIDNSSGVEVIISSDVDQELRDNALEFDQRDDEPRDRNSTERWQTCMRLPWDVAYRIMRLATTTTDGKIQRTIDGLPIGFCLADKSDLLAKVAEARRKSELGRDV